MDRKCIQKTKIIPFTRMVSVRENQYRKHLQVGRVVGIFLMPLINHSMMNVLNSNFPAFFLQVNCHFIASV